MINEPGTPGAGFSAGVESRPAMGEVFEAPRWMFAFECYDKDGNLKWAETIHNTVCTEGKKDILDQYFGTGAAGTAPSAIYLGLISADSYSSHAVGDTAAQINGSNGWKEANSSTFNPTYTGSRKSLQATLTAASGTTTVTKTTSATQDYVMTGPGTVKGAFIIAGGSATTGNTTGKLYSAGLFSESGGADRAVLATDTLKVTPSLTMAA